MSRNIVRGPVMGYCGSVDMIHEQDLVEQIEAFELAIVCDYIRTQQRLQPQAGAEMLTNPCATAIYDGAGLETRIAGFGSDQAGDETDLRELLDWLGPKVNRPRPTSNYAAPPGIRFILGPLTGPKHRARLNRLGCVFHSASNVLTRSLKEPIREPVPTIEACQVRQSDRDSAVTMITRGFLDGGEPNEQHHLASTSYFEVPGAVHFTAQRNGKVMGGCAMFVRGEFALLTRMSVLPEYRGQRIQSTLIRHRLLAAKALGVQVAVMTAAPCQRSQRNAEREGFSAAYPRISLLLDTKSVDG